MAVAKFFYHGTTGDNLNIIAFDGLRPRRPEEPATFREFQERTEAIFVTDTEILARVFARNRREILLDEIGPPPETREQDAYVPFVLRFDQKRLPIECRIEPDIIQGLPAPVAGSWKILGCVVPPEIIEVKLGRVWKSIQEMMK